MIICSISHLFTWLYFGFIVIKNILNKIKHIQIIAIKAMEEKRCPAKKIPMAFTPPPHTHGTPWLRSCRYRLLLTFAEIIISNQEHYNVHGKRMSD